MSEFWGGVAIGIGAFALFLTITQSYHAQAVKAKEECEKTIPRNQKCVIIAVPVTNKEQQP